MKDEIILCIGWSTNHQDKKRNHQQGMIAEMKKSASKKETSLSVLRVIVRKGVSVS